MDGICPDSQITRNSNHSYDGRHAYAELLLNSTFVFAPGGEGGHSFRFAEALMAGAIPVVTTDLLLPFEAEFSWEDCVVRVPESALLQLPSLLRSFDAPSVVVRQQACAAIRKSLYADLQSYEAYRPQFEVAMAGWARRLGL
jgi:hypothetical protein